MIITKTCNTCEHYPNDKHCIGCEWDKSRGENSKWELKENPIVIERKVLEQIRDEISELPYADDMEITHGILEEAIGRDQVLKIIDKYMKGGEKE